MKTQIKLMCTGIHLYISLFANLACAQEYVDVVKLNYNNTVQNTFVDSDQNVCNLSVKSFKVL